MTETVEVAGTAVTQETLERIFEALRAHHWLAIPAGHRPSLRKFKRATGPVASYEQVVYDLMADGSMPRWFQEQFMGAAAAPRAKGPSGPERVMEAAGFPRFVWAVRHPWEEITPARLDSWARALDGPAPAWLLVNGGEPQDRSRALAQAAIAADRMNVRGITYRTARDLCNEVASAGNYGENSKYNTLRPYRECGLLLLDGMGQEQRKAPEARALADLLQARRDHMLPTVLATEHGLAGLMQAYQKANAEAANDMVAAMTDGLSGYGTTALADGILSL